MCCFFTSLFMLGPRAAILIWWLLQPVRWEAAFDTWVWPVLGFIFAPWSTMMYVGVSGGGVTGFDWFWMALAIFADVAMWAGGGWGNRDRIPGSSATA